MRKTELTETIKLAILNAGGATNVAKAFDMERTSVYKWIYKSRVPPEHVRKLSELSGIACHIISPNIFPSQEIKNEKSPVAANN